MIPVEAIGSHPDFRSLAGLQGILVELRYATCQNFAGRVLYPDFDCAWLRREAAEGLEAAGQWLSHERPGHQLLVLDALRPQRVQRAIWKDVVGTADQLYFANPEPGSIHSFGMAVDVTLLGADGRECDMGSAFDEMSDISHPAQHALHLASGVLLPRHVAERDWLKRAMEHGGFRGISTEWWHFDHGDRERVRQEFPRVE